MTWLIYFLLAPVFILMYLLMNCSSAKKYGKQPRRAT